MSSPLTVKRRKLNDSAQFLKKPFVSPLKRTTPAATPPRTKGDENGALQSVPSALAHTISCDAQVGTTTSRKPNVAPQTNQVRSTPVRPARSVASSRDPAEVAAQRAITSLELQIRTIRNEIDTLTQASRLNSSSTDADLENLADKWRLATQSAAEEVFGTVKEKVCRMGGVQAWRDSERRKSERQMEWQTRDQTADDDDDADCEFDENGDDLPEDEVEWRKAEKARMRKETRDAMEEYRAEQDEPGEVVKQVWQEEGKDDDVSVAELGLRSFSLTISQTFTMDMMLRTLGIDLDKIGWDREAQRWI